MSAVVQWLRLKAAIPAPPSAVNPSSSIRRARRFPKVKPEPAQQAEQLQQQAHYAQHFAQQPQNAGQQSQQPQSAGQQAQHAAQQAQHAAQRAQHTSRPSSHSNLVAGSLPATGPAESVTASVAASADVDMEAAPLLTTSTSNASVNAQQEHAYMDTLAQLRSHMFEDIAVVAPDALPTAGEIRFCAVTVLFLGQANSCRLRCGVQ